MAKKYLGKLEYVCKIVTPDFKTAREILSDERIEPQVGDVVYVDGIDHIVSRVSCEYDFDKYIRTHIVYLDEIAGGREDA